MLKINDLGENLNALDYVPIISGLCPIILCIISPPAVGDNRDNVLHEFSMKKGSPL
jgi:hypothetical protein